MNKIVVGIPYVSSGSQGRELEFAIKGWKKHFKEDFRLIVVGDYHPAIDKESVEWIRCPRLNPVKDQYLPALDVVHKMMVLSKHVDLAPDFIWSNDDIYAVNDFTLNDVRILKKLSDEMPGNANSSNGWSRMMHRTKTALADKGLPVRNFSLHLPMYYEWDKLVSLIKEYDMEHVSYSFSNMYFNTYFPDKQPLVLNNELDSIKLGVYKKNPDFRAIKKAFSTKIWINNSVEGWCPELERMLDNHFINHFIGF